MKNQSFQVLSKYIVYENYYRDAKFYVSTADMLDV